MARHGEAVLGLAKRGVALLGAAIHGTGFT
jgi:hypothetical protein